MIDYGWSEFVYIFQSFWSMYGDSDVSKYDDKSQLKTESYSDFIKGHAEYLKEKARNDKFFISPDRAIVGAGKSNYNVPDLIITFRWRDKCMVLYIWKATSSTHVRTGWCNSKS